MVETKFCNLIILIFKIETYAQQEKKLIIKESLNKIVPETLNTLETPKENVSPIFTSTVNSPLESNPNSRPSSSNTIDSMKILEKIFGTENSYATVARNSLGITLPTAKRNSAAEILRIRKFSQSISFDENSHLEMFGSATNSAMSSTRKLEEFKRMIESSYQQHIETNNLIRKISQNSELISNTYAHNNINSYESQRKSSLTSLFPIENSTNNEQKVNEQQQTPVNNFKLEESFDNKLNLSINTMTATVLPVKVPYMSAYNVYSENGNLLNKNFTIEDLENQILSPQACPVNENKLEKNKQSTLTKSLSSNGSSLNASPTSISSTEYVKKLSPDDSDEAMKSSESQKLELQPKKPENAEITAITTHHSFEIKPPETPRTKATNITFRKNLLNNKASIVSSSANTFVAEPPNKSVNLNFTNQVKTEESLVIDSKNQKKEKYLDEFFSVKVDSERNHSKEDETHKKRSKEYRKSVKKAMEPKNETRKSKSNNVFKYADIDQDTFEKASSNDDSSSDTFAIFSSQESLNNSIKYSIKPSLNKLKKSNDIVPKVPKNFELMIDLGQLSDADDRDVEENQQNSSKTSIKASPQEANAEATRNSLSVTNRSSARQQIKPDHIPNLALDVDDDRSQSVAASLAQSMCIEIDYQKEMELIIKHQTLTLLPKPKLEKTKSTNSNDVVEIKGKASNNKIELNDFSTTPRQNGSKRLAPINSKMSVIASNSSFVTVNNPNIKLNDNNKFKIINSTLNQVFQPKKYYK